MRGIEDKKKSKIWDFIDKNKSILILGLFFLIIAGSLIFFFDRSSKSENLNSNIVRIDISGAVKKPGVYQIKEGSIVEDAIKLAGGITKDVSENDLAKQINRAEILSDGQKIIIPIKTSISESSQTFTTTTQEVESKVAGSSTSKSTSTKAPDIQGKININSASLSELDKLPGIGPAYAQRIIDYRNSSGGFKSINEIENVKGIGPKTFEKIKDYITI